MTRVRAGVLYFGALVVYYSAAVTLAFGASSMFSHPWQIVPLFIQFAAMCVATFCFLMYEEDWWNDFKDQHRSMLLGFAGNALAVVAGAWLAG